MVAFDLDAIAPLVIGIGAILMLIAKLKSKRFCEYSRWIWYPIYGNGFNGESMSPIANQIGLRNLY